MANKAILIGRAGKDPELRYTNGGSAIANFSLATSSKYKDKAGETKENTQWHNIVVFGKLAEISEKYIKKGSQIYVDGEIRYEEWNDKEGNKRLTTKILANNIEFLGGNQSSQQSKQTTNQQQNEFDDDIPF